MKDSDKKEKTVKNKLNFNMFKKNLSIIRQSAKTQVSEMKSAEGNNFYRGIGIKLFIVIFISIVICVVAVGTLSYQKAKSLIETNVSGASLQTMSQVANSIDVVMNSYIETSFQIMFDTTIVENMQTVQTEENTYDIMRATREITEKLNNYMVTNTTIKNIALIPTNEKSEPIVSGSLSNYSVERKSTAAYKENEWYVEAEEKGGIVQWIEPQKEGIIEPVEYETIGLARMVRNMTNNNLSFMLVIELNSNNLFDAANSVQFGKHSEVFIASKENTYVFADDKTKYDTAPNFQIPTSQIDEEGLGSTTIQGNDKRSYLAVYDVLQMNDEWTLIGALPVESLVAQAKPIRTVTIVTSIIAIILAIFIGTYIVLSVGRPLFRLTELMQKGARGDLTVRSSVKPRKDEIGLLSNSFNEMMVQIQALATQSTKSAVEVLKTATELSMASQKTSVAAKEIAIATDEIASGASSLAVEAEKGTDLTNVLNNQMEQVNEYSIQMTKSADEVEHASQQGTSYMGVLIEKTGVTEQMTRAMVDKVNGLKESTSSIVKILDVLNAVTKQTNILSLNATIEAARAGAAGKGFMVVADEIRQLADQSKHSIEVVAQITHKISSEIEETVAVLSEAYPLFQEQIGSVKEANQLFLSVQAQMESFKHSMELVTDSFAELNRSQEILNDSMNNVSAVAQQSSATSEEVASLSTEQLSISNNLVDLSNQLETVSNGLKDSLSKFKI